jgi:hypothetical protein
MLDRDFHLHHSLNSPQLDADQIDHAKCSCKQHVVTALSKAMFCESEWGTACDEVCRCSFFEIQPDGKRLLLLDLDIDDDIILQPNIPLRCPSSDVSFSANRPRYRAWIGAMNLHIA